MVKKKLWIAVLVVVVLASLYFISEDYDKFEYNIGFNGLRCEHYYEECTCYGLLTTFESYPPKFECRGLENCDAVDYNVGC